MPSIRCYAVFGAMVAVSAAACSAPADLTSLRAVQPITIDADPAEWDGKTTYLKDDGVSFGVQHDGDALYVNWVVSDPALERLVLGRGITLWIDPDGGDDPEVGIRFPLGLHERKRDPWNPDTPDGPPPPSGLDGSERVAEDSPSVPSVRSSPADGTEPPEPSSPSSELDELLKGMLGSMDLIAGSDTLRVAPGEKGVDVAVASVGVSLVYEARISLAPDGFLARHAPKGIGPEIGLGLEAAQPALGEGMGRPGGRGGGPGMGREGGGPPPGGMGGSGGPGGRGGPGGMGGRPPGGMTKLPSLDLWLEVALEP
ncbi:MAG: hypothetical protein KDA27_22860 [Candidatus Eisenbacteria bacterium]|uniref:Collagen-like protein n=1 Tax=Eiseniibacteriota bacterium TaxID=2212470 RepID=A0A956NK84_UNCEI|nr:hypothetical protein [Candidatus Eisenbacteria bacterium]